MSFRNGLQDESLLRSAPSIHYTAALPLLAADPRSVHAACDAPDGKAENSINIRLDKTDWKILAELQAHGRITNVELARKVGLSAPPCLRRVRALEQAGIIERYCALISEKAIGFDVTAFAMVGLHSQAEADLVAFEERVRGWPLVRECHMLSGEIDFILKCVAPDLSAFQHFIINELTAAPNVDAVKTSLAIRRSKFEPGSPIQVA